MGLNRWCHSLSTDIEAVYTWLRFDAADLTMQLGTRASAALLHHCRPYGCLLVLQPAGGGPPATCGDSPPGTAAAGLAGAHQLGNGSATGWTV